MREGGCFLLSLYVNTDLAKNKMATPLQHKISLSSHSWFSFCWGLWASKSTSTQMARRGKLIRTKEEVLVLIIPAPMYFLLFSYLLYLNFNSKETKTKKLIMDTKRGKYYKYQIWAGYVAQVLIKYFMCFLSERSAVLYIHCLTCFQVCLWAH